MPSAEETIASVISALANLQAFVDTQANINQVTEQRLDAFHQRFDTVDQRFTNLEASLKEVLHCLQRSSPRDSSEPQSPRPASTTDKTKPESSWAAIASKPPAPLTDRKRQALHRAFNPPATDNTQNGSYTFVYLPRSRRMNRSQIRSKFREISIDNLRVLDITFPARNTIGVLLHEAYLSDFQSKLLDIDSHLIQNFDPLDHNHIADPKYQDLSEERRTHLAKALHQDRCIRSLYFIRPHLVPGVASYFIRQGWVPTHIATDIIHQRLPRPAKRRPDPRSLIAKTLQASNPTYTQPLSQAATSQVPPAPMLYDYFGNPVASQEMDITADFASNASAEEISRSGSPVSVDADVLSQ
ncbi:hypothetical protein MAM1_0144d06482 [Mucor ambiguus]|uniref:Uncharacterized protein n=1 Tax=Mucor ambiguus TaxID=91626 RepID=A0A0C9MU94_9FUNG|nr:hypothetical protein MAM1_0144d06482 [Mucor ambiguus]